MSSPLAYIEATNEIGNPAKREKALRQFDGTQDYHRPLCPSLAANAFKDSAPLKQVYFDIWARGRQLYEVYLSQPHMGNRLTREDFHPERKLRPDQPSQLQWDRVGEWKFDFTGPFYVATSGDERFIVTDNGGRIFLAPRGAKPGTPLKEIWKGPPVEALVHDSDATKWYAFTKEQWFEIATEIKPKPHRIEVRRAWTAESALETVARCGRVIRGLPEPKAR